MAECETVRIKELYIDSFRRLLGLIAQNYDWKNHHHPVYIEKIGAVGLTDEYKGKKGDRHQVFRNIKLKIRTDISDDKRKELDEILEL